MNGVDNVGVFRAAGDGLVMYVQQRPVCLEMTRVKVLDNSMASRVDASSRKAGLTPGPRQPISGLHPTDGRPILHRPLWSATNLQVQTRGQANLLTSTDYRVQPLGKDRRMQIR